MKLPKWLLLFIALQIALFFILAALILARNQQEGPKGDRGDSAVVDYKLLTDYVKEEIAKIPRPNDGVNGTNASDEQVARVVAAYLMANPPAPGADGKNGSDSTVPGPTGETGPAAPKYETRCRDFSNKKSQVQYKYENEENWKLLYELPHKCNGSYL